MEKVNLPLNIGGSLDEAIPIFWSHNPLDWNIETYNSWSSNYNVNENVNITSKEPILQYLLYYWFMKQKIYKTYFNELTNKTASKMSRRQQQTQQIHHIRTTIKKP